MTSVFIIAEAGVNHNGSAAMASELVEAAAAAGADAVKFQSFRAENLVTAEAALADYQTRSQAEGTSQFEMLRQLELPDQVYRDLAVQCADRNITFLSTPFDPASVNFLAGDIGVSRLKLGSGALTNGPLLHAAAATGKPVILSTGLGTLDEIRAALGVLACGYVDAGAEPSTAAFETAFASKTGQAALKQAVVILHCTSAYPTPLADVNLRAIGTLAQTFSIPVGFSDHTEGIYSAVAAAALGAVVIEKHLTLDKNQPGPDHAASIEPGEMSELVAAVRQIEIALGSPEKKPAPSEQVNAVAIRQSLVAARDILDGEILDAGNITVKRPGNGISPMKYWQWIGRRADRSYKKDEAIGP